MKWCGGSTIPPRRYSLDRVIHELFEEQVRHTPDAAAVMCKGRSVPDMSAPRSR